MKTTFIVLLFSLVISTAFAGEMKKIDQVTRETIANEYYFGADDLESYQDYMYSQIWNLKIGPSENKDCLVIVSGNAVDMYTVNQDIYKFKVCVTKRDGIYFGEYLGGELIQ